MSSRYWRVLAAFAGLAALFIAAGTGAYFGSLYGPDHKQYQAIAGDQSGQKDYQGPSQSLADISGVPGLVERVIANPQPGSGQDHEKRDLAAQEAMAAWAFWMVLAAFLSVLVTTVGTILLYKQIVLTRRAVEDTGDATDAMREANRIALEAQRPWLQIEKVEAKIYALESQDIMMVHVYSWITVKNTGQRPAIKVDRRDKVQPTTGRNVRTQFYAESRAIGWYDVPNVPPGGSTTISVLHSYDIKTETLEKIALLFSIHISVTYEDSLIERRRQTAQSYALCKKVAPNGTMVPFSKDELLAPPTAQPGDWSMGWDCELWPESDGIMT